MEAGDFKLAKAPEFQGVAAPPTVTRVTGVTRVTRYAPAPGSIEQLIPLWLALRSLQ